MNRIGLLPAQHEGLRYLDIQVDGVRLANHFVGRRGAHPSQLSPLAWSTSTREFALQTIAQLLLESPAPLQSGRIPVLVCEMYGDVACGAFAVRIARHGDSVTWSDWAFENGYEPPHSVEEWHDRPQQFHFAWSEYEEVLSAASRALASGV